MYLFRLFLFFSMSNLKRGGNWDLERERYTANSNQTSKGGGGITYLMDISGETC